MSVTVSRTGAERAISFLSPLPPTKVYDYLSDFSRHHEWTGEIESMEQTTSGPAGVGTGYRTVEAMRPGSRMKGQTSCEITAMERPGFIAWNARTAANRGPMAMRSRWSFTIEPEGDGCRVTQRYAMEPPNPWSRAFLRVFVTLADGLGGGMGASPKNVVKHAENLEVVLQRDLS